MTFDGQDAWEKEDFTVQPFLDKEAPELSRIDEDFRHLIYAAMKSGFFRGHAAGVREVVEACIKIVHESPTADMAISKIRALLSANQPGETKEHP